MEATKNESLTQEQIKNWRTVLIGLVGPWALLMPDAEVQALRDEMQAQVLQDDIEKHEVTDSK